MTKESTVSLQGTKLDVFKSLFFSKEEHQEMIREAVGEVEGWKGKIKKGVVTATTPRQGIKDPVFRSRVIELLEMHGLENPSATGYCETIGPSSATVNLHCRAGVPSWLYRLLFEDEITLPLQIVCSEQGGTTLLTLTQKGKSILGTGGCLGCIITMIAFGLFIVPGVVYLYLTRVISNTWSSITDSVTQALTEALAE